MCVGISIRATCEGGGGNVGREQVCVMVAFKVLACCMRKTGINWKEACCYVDDFCLIINIAKIIAI